MFLTNIWQVSPHFNPIGCFLKPPFQHVGPWRGEHRSVEPEEKTEGLRVKTLQALQGPESGA